MQTRAKEIDTKQGNLGDLKKGKERRKERERIARELLHACRAQFKNGASTCQLSRFLIFENSKIRNFEI